MGVPPSAEVEGMAREDQQRFGIQAQACRFAPSAGIGKVDSERVGHVEVR